MKTLNLSFLFLGVLMLSYSCEKENKKTDSQVFDLWKEGCKPLIITRTTDFTLGSNSRSLYNYDFDSKILESISVKKEDDLNEFIHYEYENGLPKRITTKFGEDVNGRLYRYTDFEYDNEGRITKRVQMRNDQSNGQLRKASDYIFEYDEQRIIHLSNLENGYSTDFFYSSENLYPDSLIETNSTKTVKVSYVFEFDDQNNIYENYLIPTNHFHNELRNLYSKNIISEDINRILSLNDTIRTLFNYEMTYNEFGFPDTIKQYSSSGFYTEIHIQYTDCQ